MQRGGGRDWYASGESSRDSDRTTGMPVGTSNFVVVPTGERWRSVDASDSSGLSEVGDGLFSVSSSEQEGFVLPESGAGSGDDQVSIYVAGVGGRFMSPEAFAGLEDALAAGYARALWAATDEAQRNVDNEVKRLPTVPRELRTPPPLEVVWTGRLPDHPQAAIIAQGRGRAQALALGYAAPPDEEDSNDDFIVGAQLLGFGDPGRSSFDASETAVAGEYVELDDVPYLVLAGTGVETLHALVGDREVSRRAPAAVIDARPFAQLQRPARHRHLRPDRGRRRHRAAEPPLSIDGRMAPAVAIEFNGSRLAQPFHNDLECGPGRGRPDRRAGRDRRIQPGGRADVRPIAGVDARPGPCRDAHPGAPAGSASAGLCALARDGKSVGARPALGADRVALERGGVPGRAHDLARG